MNVQLMIFIAQFGSQKDKDDTIELAKKMLYQKKYKSKKRPYESIAIVSPSINSVNEEIEEELSEGDTSVP